MSWEKETDPVKLRALLDSVKYQGVPMTLGEVGQVQGRIEMLEAPVEIKVAPAVEVATEAKTPAKATKAAKSK